jgi:hypothetical protein
MKGILNMGPAMLPLFQMYFTESRNQRIELNVYFLRQIKHSRTLIVCYRHDEEGEQNLPDADTFQALADGADSIDDCLQWLICTAHRRWRIEC